MNNLLDFSLCIIQSSFAYFVLQKIIEEKRKLKNCQQDQVMQVSDVQNIQSNYFEGCVYGNLYSDDYFNQVLSSDFALYSEFQKERLHQNYNRYLPPFYSFFRAASNMYLIDQKNKKQKLQFLVDLEPSLSQIKKFSKENIIAEQPSKAKNIFISIFKNFNYILEGIFGFGFFRGLEIGIREREFIVELHTPVFVYASFYKDKLTQEFRIKNLDYMKRSLTEIQKLIKRNIFKQYILFFIASSFAIYFFKISYKQIFAKIKRFLKDPFKFLKRKNQIFEQNILVTSHIYCQKCKSRPNNILLKPCHHLVLCGTCYDELKSQDNIQKCPKCDEKVTTAENFYIVQLIYFHKFLLTYQSLKKLILEQQNQRLSPYII